MLQVTKVRRVQNPKKCVRQSFLNAIAFVGALLGGLLNAQYAQAFEATNSYSRLNINGWTVYMSSEFATKTRERNAILRKLQTQTAAIAKTLSAGQLKVMRKSDIWVEAGTHYRSLARYHGTKNDIYQESLNPKKNRDVEIFGNFARARHPSLVLHELAHVYHDRKLGWSKSRIKKMYATFRARASSAKDRCGRTVRAYALENEHEFFATFTESYFGKTCTYPFNRATIQKNHPEMFAFLVKTWGQ